MKNCYLLGALVADSLALAPHWIYKPEEILQSFGRVEGLLAPLPGSYHEAQPKGGQTHLGHQTIVLAQALEQGQIFSQALREFWASSTSYRDKATKDFLVGKSASSDELAGAARMAAVLANFDTLESAQPVLREQTLVTHSELVATTAESLLALFFDLKSGRDIKESVSDRFKGELALSKATAVAHLEPATALGVLGRDCSLESALPSLIYFLNRATDYRESLIDNVMAGGDSAARGLVLGTLLVAAFGSESIPIEWTKELRFR